MDTVTQLYYIDTGFVPKLDGCNLDRFGDDVTIYVNDMDSFGTVVNVAVSNVFYSWVFGFSGKIKIKDPETVREV